MFTTAGVTFLTISEKPCAKAGGTAAASAEGELTPPAASRLSKASMTAAVNVNRRNFSSHRTTDWNTFSIKLPSN
jgi:hypothetical protein